MRDVTILITAAGNVFMPGTTACIKNNGERNVRLIGADMNDDSSMLQMVDAYYSVPRGDDPEYIEALLRICKKEHVDILLPIMSVELDALAENKEKFEAIGTKISISDTVPLAIANDKLSLFNFMRENKIPCADYFSVHNLAEFDEAVQKLGYPNKPVCVKATHSSGSRGFRILDESHSRFDLFIHEKPSTNLIRMKEMKSLLAEAEEFPELMVMEYLPGEEYTVDLLADKGRVLYNCCRRSLKMENSIMLDSIVEDNKSVTDLCASVTQKLGLNGNIGFDVKERADKTPIIMECNPRITAGIPVFAMAGVNLPYLCVKLLLGEELPDVTLEYEKIIHRRWMEM